MNEIIDWLKTVEKSASDAYKLAEKAYSDDKDLKAFFKEIAEDEELHFRFISNAEKKFLDTIEFNPAILVEKEIKDKISTYFSNIKAGFERGKITKEDVIQNVVEAELSEWNDIFVYIVNSLKEKTNDFKHPAAMIQTHIKRIEYFLESTKYANPKLFEQVNKIPMVWAENILIVDDEKPITELIKSLLHRSGNIDIAYNGREAMEFIDKKFYKLVISDIDMPIVDGITLYKNVAEKYPNIKNRFLFLSGYIDQDKQTFLNNNQLEYLEKPMQILELREKACQIILSK